MSARPTTGAGMRGDLTALRRVWPLLGVRPARLALAATWGSLTLGAGVGLAATSAWLIARASQMPPVLDLTIAVVTVRALGIGRGVFRYLDRLAGHDVALRGSVALRERLYARLSSGRPDVVTQLRRGEVLQRWGSDVDDVGDLVVRGVLPVLVAAVVGAGSVALVGAFSPATALVLAAMLLLTGLAGPLLVVRSVRRGERDGAAARARVAAVTTTVLDGAGELAVAGRLSRALGLLADAESDLRTARDAAARPAALAQAVTVAATGASVLAAIALGAAALARGDLAPVELAVIVLTPLAAFEAATTLTPAAQHLVRAADAARRVLGLLDDAAGASSGTAFPDAGAPTIRARDLVVGRPGRAPLLTGVDMDLAPGRAVVLRGPNGSGKTTLLLTLAGLLPPLAGAVRIGDVDAADLADGGAAQVVSLTAEDAHLFDTSVLENLRVARGDVTEDEARGALATAGLAGTLARLPEGLATRVGPGGAMLSGGERRRLLVARALLGRAPLLLLDEPDEHLDPDTAEALLRDVLALRQAGRGVLVVTHRRSAATAAADQVLDLGATAVPTDDREAQR